MSCAAPIHLFHVSYSHVLILVLASKTQYWSASANDLDEYSIEL